MVSIFGPRSYRVLILVRSHHEMSHVKADERLNNRKWPWQREGGQAAQEDSEEALRYSNKELYHKFRWLLSLTVKSKGRNRH